MGGIAGIVRFGGAPVPAEALAGMARALAYRGTAVLRSSPAGSARFAELRITVREEPGERRDARDDADLVVVADARIDNRAALEAALGASFEPGSAGTAALLRRAYRRWGAECAEHLTGAFAFCIWDEPQRRLFCARDHLGLKPFVYALLPDGGLAFASDIAGVLAAPGVPARLDERRLGDYLLDIGDDLAATFFADVRRLPPAHTLTAGPAGTAVRRYWSLAASRELRLPSDRDYADAFGAAFARAVARCVQTGGRPGVMLSGGLDSSAIACVASDQRRASGHEPLASFTAIYGEDPAGDERAYAQAVIEATGMEAHFIRADRVGRLDHADALIAQLGEPFENPGLSVGWAVQAAVAAAGVEVILDGTMGDAALSYDFSYLSDLARGGRFATLAREAVGLSRTFYGEQVSATSLVWALGLRPWLESLRPPRHRSAAAIVVMHPLTRCIHPEFVRRLKLAERQREYLDAERAPVLPQARHAREVTGSIMARSAELRNRLSARFGVEDRHPYYDKELLELCVALPREQRVRDGWTRFVARNALRGTLPDSIRRRGGKWTPAQFMAEATHERGVADFAPLVRDEPPELAGILDWDVVRAAYERLVAGPSREDLFTVWGAVNVRRWFEIMEPSASMV